ncbi:glutathione peroxidase [Ramlibacter algicola]|uniref:Glutathione peroxidase n=1 Tax=Ramlibacter algicola TaxID=2795217 RepID=A0A934PY77_9BURK|nr:glutathione peroxidase [Ramlibacter algicola]MBK0391261.1 glutathione peroxidase [Ramlibacter algicola]
MLRTIVFLLACSAALAAPAHAQVAPPATSAASCPQLLDKTFPRLQDEKPQSLCQYAGKVLLVVNTASYCGFTPQYQGLEALHAKYKERGLVVLGFPSNDFLQEKGSNKDIAEFCENTFGVKFPMFAASSVRGSKANALFKDLSAATGESPKWNFNKYLVGRNGQPVAYYGSTTTPDDKAFVARIEQLLAAP